MTKVRFCGFSPAAGLGLSLDLLAASSARVGVDPPEDAVISHLTAPVDQCIGHLKLTREGHATQLCLEGLDACVTLCGVQLVWPVIVPLLDPLASFSKDVSVGLEEEAAAGCHCANSKGISTVHLSEHVQEWFLVTAVRSVAAAEGGPCVGVQLLDNELPQEHIWNSNLLCSRSESRLRLEEAGH